MGEQEDLVRELMEALDPFMRVYRLNEPISQGWPDDRGAREIMPGAWPKWRDLRRAAEAHAKAEAALTS